MRFTRGLIVKLSSIREMRKHWGGRCCLKNSYCPYCMAWRIYDKTGKIPSVDEVACMMNGRIKYKAGAD